MSHPYDHVDMGRDHGLDDRTAEDILRGRADAVGAEHQGLADALNAIRHSARAQPRPSEHLQSIFASGIAEDELADAPVTAPAKRPLLARGGASLRGSVAKVAGLSLLVKLTVGGVAVAAAGVGGAGMAGVLPGQDRPEPEPAEEADLGQEIADEAVEEGGVDGREISERVREPRGDEPGGELPPDWSRDVGERDDEARDDTDGTDRPGEDPRDHAPEEADRGLDDAEGHTEDAPAGERTTDTADDAREDADGRADRRSGEDRAPVEEQPEDQQPGSATGSSATEPAPDAPSVQPSQDADTAAPGDRTLGR